MSLAADECVRAIKTYAQDGCGLFTGLAKHRHQTVETGQNLARALSKRCESPSTNGFDGPQCRPKVTQLERRPGMARTTALKALVCGCLLLSVFTSAAWADD